MEKSTEKDLAESVVKAIEEDAITESEMETTEGGHNGNCGCVPKTRPYEARLGFIVVFLKMFLINIYLIKIN